MTSSEEGATNGTASAAPDRGTVAQAGRFGAVGVLNTLLDYGLFVTFAGLFHVPLDRVWIPKLAAGTIALANSFLLNRTWVFRRSGGDASAQALKFLIVTVTSVLVVQTSLTHLFASEMPGLGLFVYGLLERIAAGADVPVMVSAPLVIKTVAFVVATPVSMTCNFLGYRHWVFASRSPANGL